MEEHNPNLRNGWAVMAILSKMTHANGVLGTVSVERIAQQSGF